jgi:hypothetical protein
MLSPYYTNVTLHTPITQLFDDEEGRYRLRRHLVYLNGEWVTFIHLDVYFNTAKTMRDMVRDWAPIRANLPPIICALPVVDDRKFERFAKYFGWEPGKLIPCQDGPTRRLFLNIRSD